MRRTCCVSKTASLPKLDGPARDGKIPRCSHRKRLARDCRSPVLREHKVDYQIVMSRTLIKCKVHRNCTIFNDQQPQMLQVYPMPRG